MEAKKLNQLLKAMGGSYEEEETEALKQRLSECDVINLVVFARWCVGVCVTVCLSVHVRVHSLVRMIIRSLANACVLHCQQVDLRGVS